MAGTIQCDYLQPSSSAGLTIQTPSGNTIASINTSGVFSSTGSVILAANGQITSSSFPGYVTANNGVYSANNYTGPFNNGIVMDYASSNGRISVGNSSGIKLYNNGVANNTLLTIDRGGNVGIGTENPIRNLVVSKNGSPEIVLQDTSQATDAKNWRVFTNSSSLILGTLNDAGSSGTDIATFYGSGPSRGFSLNGNARFITSLSSGHGIRVAADSTNANGIIQFTDTAQTSEWASIGTTAVDKLVLRTSIGRRFVYGAADVAINGAMLIIDRFQADGQSMGDWPNPTLGLRNHDSDFNGRTMLLMGGRDDNVTYQTDAALWAWRLWNDAGTSGWTTSDGNTALEWRGPGVLRIQAGGSNGVQLAKGATSWTTWSDVRFKDIIEPITNASEKLLSIRSVIGKYKTDPEGTRRSMFLAQDFLDVLPEAVTEGVHWGEVDPDDIKKQPTRSERYLLSYSDTIPLISAAVNEHTTRISELEAKIAELESKLK